MKLWQCAEKITFFTATLITDLTVRFSPTGRCVHCIKVLFVLVSHTSGVGRTTS